MRRLFGVVAAGVLAGALCSAVTCASVPVIAIPSYDLGAQLAQRVFGETTAPTTESFLREDVFRVDLSALNAPSVDYASVSLPILAERVFAIPRLPAPIAYVNPPAYVGAVTASPVSTGAIKAPAPIPVVGAYQEQQPILTTASSSAPLLSFTGDAPPQGGSLSLPVRLGRVRLSTHAETQFSQSPDFSVADRAVGAGATLNLRAGRRNLGLDVSSTVEQVNFNAAPSLEANDPLPVFVPSYADVNKHTLSAGLTVPISRRLTGSFQIDSQHLLGGYGLPGLANLDANNTIYGARVTFQLPKSASAISLSAQQFHYQDNLLPANAYVQTSANVDFTIKF